MQFILAVLSLGAPLWFAWLSTRQIGQRFKLAEDYGFKAAVAKAYEGYRREAARIDPNLESKLFESALARVDEAPLRLIEDKDHSSPWGEMADSDGFKNAVATIPGLKERFEAVLKSLPKPTKASELKKPEEN